ncbi:MAG TPA: hypothetical protein PKO36_03820 [Candidatus Hydrogenedentes bacterium]|nr:hypothetical protein [Candidatus Hydrogenedentota bacterium]
MARGSVYGPERAIFTEPRSGLRIVQLTHHSTIAMNMYFEMCSFTEDERHVVLLAQRSACRDAPWDLLRARTDGSELVQLTECDAMGGAVICPALNAALYFADREVRKVDLLSLHETVVAEAPAMPYPNQISFGAVDEAGAVYFASGRLESGRGAVFRVAIGSGRSEVVFEGECQNHLHIDPQGSTLYFGENTPNGCVRYLIDANGHHLREYGFDCFAHHTWFGRTGLMQGCLLPPGQAIATYREGDDTYRTLTQGRYYWHSSASRDAQWIVADTNWPREGIFLLHVPSGTVTFVCDPLSSCSHPQWTHPHPSLSPSLKFVLFNSDRTGLGQVYLAELSPEFIEQAASGAILKPVALDSNR